MTVLEKFSEFEDHETLNFEGLGDFDTIIMDRRMTSNTTRLRRLNSFKVLLFGGNYNGIIGYGKGSGHNGQIAMKNAMNNLKQNLIAINLDYLNTFPRGMYAKFGSYEITLHPRQKFNSWGSKTSLV